MQERVQDDRPKARLEGVGTQESTSQESRRTEGFTLGAVDHQEPESERRGADHPGDYAAGNEASKPCAHDAPPCSVFWSVS